MTEYTLTSDASTRFITAFNFLASTKNTQIDDLKQEGYFKRLSDLPIDAVEEVAYELAKEPSPYLPDAGTWYSRADSLAARQLEHDRKRDVRQLSSGRHPEHDEIERTKIARDKFVAQMEQLTGRILPDDHPMKTRTPTIPTFSCVTCNDIGWVSRVDAEGVERAQHCVCWDRNPVLLRKRAEIKVKTAAGRVG